MKKLMDKLKSKIRTSKKFTIFLSVLLIVGVISGTFFISMLASSDKELVKEYVTNYMAHIKTDKIDYLAVFINSFSNELLISIAIWLLGISVVGIPIILFLYFSKTFVLGFSVGSLFYVYQTKGFLFTLSYLFPHKIITLFAYGFLTMYALSISLKMIEAVFKHKTLDFKIIMKKYTMVLGISVGLLLISSLLETFLMPNMMKWVLTLLK